MPLLGAHMSIEGGLHRAFERIGLVRGEALQIFSKNQRQWSVPPLSAAEDRQQQQKGCDQADRMPPDEDDVVFLEVALQTSARVVVTGNLKHFPEKARAGVKVVSPREFLDVLLEG